MDISAALQDLFQPI